MKKIFCAITAAICLLVCITGTNLNTASAAEKTVTLKVTGQYKRQMAAQVLTLVNSERTSRGYSKLKWDSTLEKAALRRAAETAVKFSHTRPDGTMCYTVNNDAIVKRFPTSGENLAAGSMSAKEAMNGWMNSPGHKANILDNNFTHIGIACAKVNGVLYWVQVFGGGDYGEGKKSSGKGGFTVSVKAIKRNTRLFITQSNNIWNSGKQKNIKLAVGTTQKFKVAAYDIYDNFGLAKLAIGSFKLRSSDKKVLTVSKKGKVKALKSGTAYITAVSKTDKSLKIRQKITVTN